MTPSEFLNNLEKKLTLRDICVAYRYPKLVARLHEKVVIHIANVHACPVFHKRFGNGVANARGSSRDEDPEARLDLPFISVSSLFWIL
jgi:hypothetical protein